MSNQDRRPFDQLPAATQAGILCNQTDFQTFMARKAPDVAPLPGETLADITVRRVRTRCRVQSRAELDRKTTEGEQARSAWHSLRFDFMQATGRIAEQRG